MDNRTDDLSGGSPQCVQPNPSIRSLRDLSPLAREHFEVAAVMPKWCSPRAFRDRYRMMFPQRTPGSMIPSDYCFFWDNKGNPNHPRFMIHDDVQGYHFVGLDGKGGQGEPALLNTRADDPRSLKPAARSRFASQSSMTGRLFKTRTGCSLRIDPVVAETAIRAYNADARVRSQEERASSAIGQGIRRGEVISQLRALDSAYSTRSKGSDIDTIGGAIESGWQAWTATLAIVKDLADEVADPEMLVALLRPFLASATERLPRSLATKALHFAAPKSFIPADAYAVDFFGRAIGCGTWADTQGLGLEPFAAWYGSYLAAVRELQVANRDLVNRLIEIDAETAPGPDADRVRGLPKIIDKLLWLVGREERQNRKVRLFAD